MSELGFHELRTINAARCVRWHAPGSLPWSLADWSNAMQGEAGEAGNVVKKIRRHETSVNAANDPPSPELFAKLADELADTIIYADLLAHEAGIDLGAAVVSKFNATSEREGFPERLGESDV